MNRSPCTGCGLWHCNGQCFDESPADYPDAVEVEEGDSGITLAELRAKYGDPLIDLKPNARRAAKREARAA